MDAHRHPPRQGDPQEGSGDDPDREAERSAQPEGDIAPLLPPAHADVSDGRAEERPEGRPEEAAATLAVGEEFAARLSGGKPFAEFEQEFFKTVRPSSLLKRFATTEEVANLVTYVCSPLSSCRRQLFPAAYCLT